MTDRYETREDLEDQIPIPEDATEAEREQIRAENEAIRERNQQRINNAAGVGTEIGRKNEFLAAGSNALSARDAMAADDAIPQSVLDFADGQLVMNYLVYIHLAGEQARLPAFEDRFF